MWTVLEDAKRKFSSPSTLGTMFVSYKIREWKGWRHINSYTSFSFEIHLIKLRSGPSAKKKRKFCEHPKMYGEESISKIHFCLNLLTRSLNVELLVLGGREKSSRVLLFLSLEQAMGGGGLGMCEGFLWCRINFETFSLSLVRFSRIFCCLLRSAPVSY